jgi:hypothetical protein
VKLRLEFKFILIDRFSASAGWDYERFAESDKKRESGKFFPEVHLGSVTEPMTLVDMHGKILMWYLPGLLLPHRVVRSTAPVQNPLFLLTLLLGRVEQGNQEP